MKRRFALAGAAILALTSAASLAAPITMAEATKHADATVTAWLSMNAAKIKALYGPGIVGFDMVVAPLVTDKATWNTNQDAFAAAKLDKAVEKQRKIQILDVDTFVVSGLWDLTSSAVPANAMTVRCTDVYEKRGESYWPIVNEHCSVAPKG